MPKSVEDGATIPILYEARLPELAVWGTQLDPIFEAQFTDLTPEQRERLKQQEVTEKKVASLRAGSPGLRLTSTSTTGTTSRLMASKRK